MLSSYQRLLLLKTLAEVNYSEECARQYKTAAYLGDAGLEVDLSKSIEDAVKSLVEHGSFVKARDLAASSGLDADYITLQEASDKLQELQRSDLSASRLAMEVVLEQCQLLFKQHGVSKATAGRWFVDMCQADGFEDKFQESAQLSFLEYAYLAYKQASLEDESHVQAAKVR